MRLNLTYVILISMSNKTRAYLLIEDRLGSDLAEHVTTGRANGKSWGAIALDLYDQTKVHVTSETLRLWFFASDREARRATA